MIGKLRLIAYDRFQFSFRCAELIIYVCPPTGDFFLRSTFSPWVYSFSLDLYHLLQTWRGIYTSSAMLLPLESDVCFPLWGCNSSHGSQPYTGCYGWVCRPFSGCLMLWSSQKALCSWSSSDMRGRPMSKCIFRFSSHSSSLEKAGLNIKRKHSSPFNFFFPPFFFLFADVVFLYIILGT